jgi:uncharacterized protein (UPF0332 family)
LNDKIHKLLAKGKRATVAAKMLLKEGNEDFSVARAYYAAFYAAEALLLSKNLAASKHSGVLSLLFEHFIKTNKIPKSYHQDLHRLFEMRQKGDYWVDFEISVSETKEAIKMAKAFVEMAERMLT